MNINELTRIMNKHGYEVDRMKYSTYIFVKGEKAYEGIIVANVSEKKQFVMDNNYQEVPQMTYEPFDALVEYAKTPLGQRGEFKK